MVYKVVLKDNCKKVNISVLISINEYILLLFGYVEYWFIFFYGWLFGINLRIKSVLFLFYVEFIDYV